MRLNSVRLACSGPLFMFSERDAVGLVKKLIQRGLSGDVGLTHCFLCTQLSEQVCFEARVVFKIDR
jgi:hypothetical protein